MLFGTEKNKRLAAEIAMTEAKGRVAQASIDFSAEASNRAREASQLIERGDLAGAKVLVAEATAYNEAAAITLELVKGM